MASELTEAARAFLRDARVGRLATADAEAWPHAVPVCFVLLDDACYIPLDEKPKRTDVRRLKRVRNLAENPRAALVVDRWDEDWSRLAWVLVRGNATVLEPGAEQARAVAALRDKYPQYRAMWLDDAPVIRLHAERVRAWGDLRWD